MQDAPPVEQKNQRNTTVCKSVQFKEQEVEESQSRIHLIHVGSVHVVICCQIKIFRHFLK